MLKIITDNISLWGIVFAFVQAVCAVISVRLAKPDRKEILYRVSTCEDRYFIAFWNNCHTVITKDDMFHFYICAKTGSTCNKEYSSNVEYRDVKIKEYSSHGMQDCHTERSFSQIFMMFDIEFEILPPKEGFIISIKNGQPHEESQLGTILINGLLKNGPIYNCVAYEHEDSILDIIMTSHFINKLVYGILVLLIILFDVSWLFVFSQRKLMRDSTLAFIIIFIASFWFLISGIALKIGVEQFVFFRMPTRLFFKYKQIVKENGAKQSYEDYRYKIKAPLR